MKTHYIKIGIKLTDSMNIGGVLVGPNKDCIVELTLFARKHAITVDLTPIEMEKLIEDLQSELYAIQDLKRKKYSK